MPFCEPDCAGKACGADSCGGSCGACPAGEGCDDSGACVPNLGDTCELPFTVGALPFTATGDTTDATSDYGYSAGKCPPESGGWGKGSRDEVYELIVESTGEYHIALAAPYDANLYVVFDCTDVDNSCVAGDEDVGSNKVEDVTVVLEAGTSYFVIVDGYTNGGTSVHGTYTLTITAVVCEPDCAGKACGADSCGGACGTCPDGSMCSSDGACVPFCVPDCAGKACGADSCGGSCGACPAGEGCDDSGACVPALGDTCELPFVVGALPFTATGDTTDAISNYGYSAGKCPPESGGWGKGSRDEVYELIVESTGEYHIALAAPYDANLYVVFDCTDVDNSCVAGDEDVGSNKVEDVTVVLEAGTSYFVIVDGYTNGGTSVHGTYTLTITAVVCEPDCAGKACGADSCGGSCGTCPDGGVCAADGTCVPACVPDCAGKACGADSCGGSCGACPDGSECTSDGACGPACVPDCAGKACGADSCGGSCGTCPAGSECTPDGLCGAPCVPDCEGKVCGADSCDGLCGTCPAGQACDGAGQCGPIPGDTCEVPFAVGALPFTASGDTTDATSNYGYSTGKCPPETGGWGKGSRDEVYELIVELGGSYHISLAAPYDANLYVVTDCGDVDNSCVAGDEDVGSNKVEDVTVVLQANTSYFIIVDGWNNSSSQHGTYTLTIEKVSGCTAGCDDLDPCTEDTCDEAAGECVHADIPGCCLVGSDCDDGDACTVDVCSIANTCQYGPSPPLPGVEEVCGDGIDNDCNPETVCYSLLHDGKATPMTPITGVQSVVGFYSYMSVNTYSADTNYEVEDQAAVLLYTDPMGNVSLVWINDEVGSQEESADGGQIQVTVSGAAGMDFLVYDDIPGPGSTGDTYVFDEATGEWTLTWFWNDCCTDGMAMGYLANDACVTLTVTAATGITGVTVWDSPTSKVALGPDASFTICASP